ncbi:transglycosylase associated protein [Citrobacter freundii]|nr:transglycosylase associated protein [Citrobacter freundii]
MSCACVHWKEGLKMGIIAWIIFGLIAGVIAKLIMPGRDGGGFILTCILGVVGAVVGGWLATMFGIGGDVSGFNLHSFLVAVVGAIVVLGVFRLVRRN